MNFLKHYLLALAVFAAVDMVWLLIIAKNLYRNKIGFLMADRINVPAAVIFYLLYIVAIVYFAVEPALARDSIAYALQSGALFGLVAYATYDLTNLATLKDWPLSVTVIDLMWGTFITGTTAVLTVWIIGRLGWNT
jgi:uncharacterized membrane protein